MLSLECDTSSAWPRQGQMVKSMYLSKKAIDKSSFSPNIFENKREKEEKEKEKERNNQVYWEDELAVCWKLSRDSSSELNNVTSGSGAAF